jgi:hypothetical protein
VIKHCGVVIGGLGVAFANLAAAQTGNPVQDAINRNAMNQAIIRQATSSHPQSPRAVPASAKALFGRWLAMPETAQLPSPGGFACTLTEIDFTPTSEVRITPANRFWASERRVQNITYVNKDAHGFYVVPQGSTTGPGVDIVDSQHIRPEYADQCLYRKAG